MFSWSSENMSMSIVWPLSKLIETMFYFCQLWLSVMFERWEYRLVPTQVWDVRPDQGSVMESSTQSRNNIYALERDLYHGQFCYDNDYQFNFEVQRIYSTALCELWPLTISGRRLRRTTVTTALLSWEKWCLTPGQSSPRLGSLSHPGVRLRWDRETKSGRSRSVNS